MNSKKRKDIEMENELYMQTAKLIEEFGEKAKLKAGDILVVGCSTSEIIGDKIGTNSNPETAQTVFSAIYDYAKEKGIFYHVENIGIKSIFM